ncbi:MAG: dihydropteroate synthase [Bacteroidaceae bacterium]|nr:dihydropteroate synthase [Bacteroidaceae bacterium]
MKSPQTNAPHLSAHRSLNVRGRLLSLDSPVVMGIINVTPDSFFKESRMGSPGDVVRHAEQMMAEGSVILDIGACSTRPGFQPVSADEEMRRLAPALEALRRRWPDAILSVDTFRADVAGRCVRDYAIDIINDISGGEWDEKMFTAVSRARVPYILTHSQEMPPEKYSSPDELMAALCEWMARRTEELRQEGVADIILDPGFGFGKTLEQNYWLMSRLSDLQIFDMPVLVGVSRKSMIHRLLGISPADALNGTTVLNTVALIRGASILRVHDVRPAVEAITITSSLKIK